MRSCLVLVLALVLVLVDVRFGSFGGLRSAGLWPHSSVAWHCEGLRTPQGRWLY